MMRLACFALAALLLAGGASAAVERSPVDSRLQLDGISFSLSSREFARMIDLANMVRSTSRAAQDRALELAREVASSRDARHLVAVYQLEIGRQRQDDALRAQALEVLIASPFSTPARLPGYLALQGDIALRAGDLAKASAAWTRLHELQPNDPQTLVNLAQVRTAQQDAPGAVSLLRRAIEARAAGPAPAPEAWYRQWLAIAHNAHLLDEGAAAAHALVAAYPTPANWRYALVGYRELAAPQAAAEIDLLRLMHAAGAFSRADEYQRFAQLLTHAGFAAEARPLLDEGLARGLLERNSSPTREIIREADRALAQRADLLLVLQRELARAGSGAPSANMADFLVAERRYAEAATLYRTALQRRGVDSATVNTRLGAALALAGRRSEAEAAFRAVGAVPTTRPYPDLARFWLAWLTRAG